MKITDISGFVMHDIFDGLVYQRARMHNRSLAEKRYALDYFNVGTVVGFAPTKIDKDLALMDRHGEITYIHHPIPDGILRDATIEWLDEKARLLTAEINNSGKAVLSHCNAGRNRSGLFNAMIVRYLTNCSGKEALEMVRKERPNAIANDYFENYLLSLPALLPKTYDVTEVNKILLIVQGGGGAAGKTSTTQAYAEGEPDQQVEVMDLPTARGVRPMKVNWTMYDNMAVIGSHKNGTDSNNGPATVKASFHKCIAAGYDVIMLDGYTSSPQWASMCHDWQEANPDKELGVLFVKYELSPDVLIERLAKRRGVKVEDMDEEKTFKWASGGARRPELLWQHFQNMYYTWDTIIVTEKDDTDYIVEMIDEAVMEYFQACPECDSENINDVPDESDGTFHCYECGHNW